MFGLRGAERACVYDWQLYIHSRGDSREAKDLAIHLFKNHREEAGRNCFLYVWRSYLSAGRVQVEDPSWASSDPRGRRHERRYFVCLAVVH
jgi:hypothetical protein